MEVPDILHLFLIPISRKATVGWPTEKWVGQLRTHSTFFQTAPLEQSSPVQLHSSTFQNWGMYSSTNMTLFWCIWFVDLSEDGITGLGAPAEAFFDFSSVIVSNTKSPLLFCPMNQLTHYVRMSLCNRLCPCPCLLFSQQCICTKLTNPPFLCVVRLCFWDHCTYCNRLWTSLPYQWENLFRTRC